MKRLKKAIVLTLIFFSVSIFGITLLPNYVQANDENTNAQVQNEEYENYSEDYKRYLALSDEEKAKLEVIPSKYDVTLEEFWNNYNRIYPEKKAIAQSSLLLKATTGSMPNQYCLSNKYNYPGNAGINIQAEAQVGGTCWDFATIMALQTSIARQTNSTTYPRFSNAHLDYLNSRYSSTPYGTGRNIGSGGWFTREYFARLDGPIAENLCEYIDDQNGNVYVYVNGQRKEHRAVIQNEDQENEEQITDEQRQSIYNERMLAANEMEKLTPSYYVHETIEFPNIKKLVSGNKITYRIGNEEITESEVEKVRNTIKHHIMEKGGIWTSVACDDSFTTVNVENGKNVSYHFDNGKLDIGYGHSITVVGWDDNISKDKFGTYVKDGVTYNKTKPVHDGAWLCMNSYGSGYSDEGYFWISYDDAMAESAMNGIVSVDQNATYKTYTLTNKKAFDKLKEIFSTIGSIKDVNDATMTMKVSDYTINSVEKLELQHCDITDADAQEIFKYPFANLRYLYLDYNKLTTISSVLVNSRLIHLGLDNNTTNGIDIRGISALGYLEWINLNSNQGVRGYTELFQLPKMRTIFMYNDKITDISGIGNLSNLEYLVLGKNSISNITEIRNLEKLTHLELDENRIEDISSLNISQYSDKLTLNGQVITKTISDTTSSFTYPDIIKRAKQQNSGIYSSEGLSFTHCEENSAGTGVNITENAKTVTITVNSGLAQNTKLRLKPILDSIEITSPDDGIYSAGETIIFLAKYLDNEYVYGDASRGYINSANAPKLKIKIGNGEVKTANLMSAITNEIRYSYTIQDGDNGLVSVYDYTGKVYNMAGQEYTVGTRTNSGNIIYADTKIPQLQSINVTSPESGTYKAGQTITMVATFSEKLYGTNNKGAITASNAPVLKIKFGNGSEKQATFASAGEKTITYTYKVVTGDTGKLASTNYTGKVYSEMGQECNVQKMDLGGNTIYVDTSYPHVQNINIISPVNGKYKAGQKIDIEVQFHEYVYGTNNKGAVTTSNAPVLKLKVGESTTEKTATFKSVNENKITYTYTITNGDNGKISISSYTGNIYDKFGNVGEVTKVDIGENDVVADTKKTEVEIKANVTSPTTANSITYLIGFSEVVEGFTQDDIKVENGEIIEFRGTGLLYAIKVSNTGNCTQKVSIPAGKCVDKAGNENVASNVCEIVIKNGDEPGPEPEKVQVLLGDINENGKIELNDIIAIIRHIAVEENAGGKESWRLNDRKKSIADATQDGKINLSDIIKLKRYMAAVGDKQVGNKNPKWKNLGTIELEKLQ